MRMSTRLRSPAPMRPSDEDAPSRIGMKSISRTALVSVSKSVSTTSVSFA